MKLTASFVALGMMLAAALFATTLRPSVAPTEVTQKDAIEKIIPATFGNWEVLDRPSVVLVNPQQQEVLDRIYTQIVNRTYRHVGTGQMIMLSIAYGSDQTKREQIHRPEICYPAQGFQINESEKSEILFGSTTIRATRLIAHQGQRTEPITYWIRIGSQIVRGSLEQKYTIVEQGLKGIIPDGVLFRVSSVNADFRNEFILHEEFIKELLKSLPAETLPILIW